MASSKEYFNLCIGTVIRFRGFFLSCNDGEYILYFRDIIIGGIYDDRLLVKPLQSARSLMQDAEYAVPYEGAKEMLSVDNVDNREFLRNLFLSMHNELSVQKKKHLKKITRKSP